MPSKKGKKRTTPSDQPQASPIASDDPSLDPITLPFTIKEAHQEPTRCRAMVSARVWELQVETEMIRKESKRRNYADPTDATRYLRYLEESALEGFYDCGLHLGRRFAEIANYLVESHEFGGDFERYWKTVLTKELREKILIGGFEGATKITGGVSKCMRCLAPDLSVPGLNSDGGQGFVCLLRHIVQSGIDFPDGSDFYPIISDVFDTSYSITRKENKSLPVPRSVRAMWTGTQTNRHNYIAAFVLNVLMNCIRNSIKKPRMPMADYLAHNKNFNNVPPPDPLAEAFLKTFEAETKDEEAIRIERTQVEFERRNAQTHFDSCGACKRRLEEIQGLQKFLYCGKCISLKPSRRVPYCSTECQKIDFKHHKKICGHKFEDLALPFAGWATPPSLPPPCISLQWQVSAYKDHQKKPYPRAIYHFRINDAFPPYLRYPTIPSSPDRKCLPLGVAEDGKELEELFEGAFKTRNQQDIKRFVLSLYHSGKQNPEIEAIALRQLSEDWDINLEKMRGWVEDTKVRTKADADQELEEMLEQLKARVIREKESLWEKVMDPSKRSSK